MLLQTRLLFIEDSEPDFRLMTATLSRAGLAHESHRACDLDTIRATIASGIDALICDYAVPGLDIRQLLGWVRRDHPDLPLLIVSGQYGEEAVVEAMRAGADDYVMKDNLRRLPHALERALREADSRRLQRQTETALASVHAQVQAIVDAAPIALVALDAAARVTLWSPGTESLTGWPASRMQGQVLTLGDPDTDQRLGSLIQRALQGESLRDEAIEWRDPRDSTEQGLRVLRASLCPLPGIDDAGCVLALVEVSDLARARAELERSERLLRDLSQHAENLREQERSEMAREIHDDLGALVIRIRAELSLARRQAPELLQGHLREAETLVESLGGAISRIARSLRPPVLDFGIVPAIEWQASDFQQRSGIQVEMHSNLEQIQLDLPRSSALFRIFQEALTNVFKHARASRVRVELFADDATVSLEIEDDGVGLPPGALARNESFGLRGMMERVRGLGGWMDVHSPGGRGTTLMISIPRHDVVSIEGETR
jgi:signal transduction histidine kinase